MKKAITLIFIFIIAVLVGRFLTPVASMFFTSKLSNFNIWYTLGILTLLSLSFFLIPTKKSPLKFIKFYNKLIKLTVFSIGIYIGYMFLIFNITGDFFKVNTSIRFESSGLTEINNKKYNCFGLEYTEKEEFVIDPDIYKAKTEEQQRENKKENTNSNSPTYSYPTTPIYQDPYPVSGGGYNGGYNTYESNTIDNAPRQKTKVRNDCPYCEDGEIIQHDYVPTFGVDGPRVYCSKCNQSWSAGTVHAHNPCNYCKGRGYTEYEY